MKANFVAQTRRELFSNLFGTISELGGSLLGTCRLAGRDLFLTRERGLLGVLGTLYEIRAGFLKAEAKEKQVKEGSRLLLARIFLAVLNRFGPRDRSCLGSLWPP